MKQVTDEVNGATFNFYGPAPLDFFQSEYVAANLLHRKYDVFTLDFGW